MKNLLFLILAEPIQPIHLDIIGVRFNLIDAVTLEVTMDKAHTLNDLFQLLEAQGIRVRSMRNKSNRLERVICQNGRKEFRWSCAMNFTQLRIALYTLVHKESSSFYAHMASNLVRHLHHHELVLCDFW